MSHPLLQRFPAYLAALLLAGLPFLVDLDCYDPALSVQLAFGGIVLTLIGILAIPGFLMLRAGKLALAGIGAGVCLLGWSWYLTSASANPAEATIDLVRLAWLLCAATIAGAVCLRSPEGSTWLFRGMLVGALLQIVLGGLQVAGLMEWPYASTAAPYGSFPNKNLLSITLVLYAPGIAWLAMQPLKLWKWLARVALAGIVLLLLLTGTRSALVGLAAGAVTVLPLMWPRLKNLRPFRKPGI